MKRKNQNTQLIQSMTQYQVLKEIKVEFKIFAKTNKRAALWILNED